MDKVTPKSDLFQANKDRVAPLLKQLRAEGVGHMIDGKIVPSISGETFENGPRAKRTGGYGLRAWPFGYPGTTK